MNPPAGIITLGHFHGRAFGQIGGQIHHAEVANQCATHGVAGFAFQNLDVNAFLIDGGGHETLSDALGYLRVSRNHDMIHFTRFVFRVGDFNAQRVRIDIGSCCTDRNRSSTGFRQSAAFAFFRGFQNRCMNGRSLRDGFFEGRMPVTECLA